MGLWNTLKTHAKAQFLDVIQWLDDSNDTLVYRFPMFNQAIQDGGKLVVREGQAGVFISEGQLSDVFGPGTYELSTRNAPIWSFFQSIKYQLDYPYKGDVYFVSTRQFTDQKWGTPKPFLMRDPEIGPVRVRAFGIYSYRVTDPAQFLREVVGTDGLFTTSEIDGQLKRKLQSAFVDAVASTKLGVLDLASRYMDMGEQLAGSISPWFEQNYGITLTDFTIENISLPEAVEKMLDRRSSMGLVGDLGAYTQFQAANALESAARNPGGGGTGAAMMNAGMGLAMGNVMAGQFARSQQPGAAPFNPATAPPPPPPPGASKLHYDGAGGSGQYTPAEIAAFVQAQPGGAHNVWAPGWPGWKPWTQVPEVASLVAPPAAPAQVFRYSGSGGGQQELDAAAIAAKLREAPGGRHLVWRPGFDGWKPASEVPEIATLLQGPPPPGRDLQPPPPPPPPPED